LILANSKSVSIWSYNRFLLHTTTDLIYLFQQRGQLVHNTVAVTQVRERGMWLRDLIYLFQQQKLYSASGCSLKKRHVGISDLMRQLKLGAGATVRGGEGDGGG
jgi:hypothetical protein